MTKRPEDKRSRRTRAWIVQAFNELLFKRGYAALGTHFISKRAGVGRSTFYEHFHNKAELLLHSASSILAVLADAVTDAGDIDRIRSVVDHILGPKGDGSISPRGIDRFGHYRRTRQIDRGAPF